MFKKIIIGTLLTIIVLLGGAAGFSYYIINRSIPNYDEHITLKGLTEDVIVYRDNHAIPHIYAKNESDLYRAIGYCMAQDRLFQMDMIRRLTSGRLSEIIGEKATDLDHLMRLLNISAKSQKTYKNTDKRITRTLDAFSDGVNQFVEKNKNRLPIEFTILGYKPEKWLPEHVFNVIGYFSFDLSTAWDTEIFFHKVHQRVGSEKLKEIIPDIAAETESIFPQFEGDLTELDLKGALASACRLIEEMGLTMFHGSNNWAVAGEKTSTGKPLFANDMHLGLNIPGIWYQMHHVVEGRFDVTGVAAPGQPFIVAGHNEHIAWGFTNVMLDDMDFYLERINPDNRDEYEFNGEWRKMKVTREMIKLKGGGEIEKAIRYTHRGPVISEIKGIADQVISMRWVGNEESNEARSLYLLNRARNWDDFKNAMRTFRSVSQNTAYADTEGNIGIYCTAGIPVREKGDGISVMPGWTDEYDWKGLVPFEEQPHIFNPEKNYISSANNKTVGNDYPHYISVWYAPDYRFRRINEMLEGKKSITIDDMKSMQADFKSKLVEDLLGDLVDSLGKATGLSNLEAECLHILRSWDGIMDKGKAAPAIFDAFYVKFAENLFGDELGDDLLKEFMSKTYIVNHAIKQLWKDRSSDWFDDVKTTGRREGFDDIVLAGFRGAIKWLSEESGADPSDWKWGDMHQLVLEHPLGSVDILDKILKLNRGPYPVSGSYYTVLPVPVQDVKALQG